MSEPTPRREETQRRLVAAAINEFARCGIDGTSVEQLCDAAGFSRGAFYSNFSSKDELCVAILESIRERISTNFTQSIYEVSPDTDLDWIATQGLLRYFEIVAPDEAHRRTLAELGQRALRTPELEQATAEVAAQIREILVGALGQLSERLDFTWLLPPRELTEVMEAVFLNQGVPSLTPNQRSMELMTALIKAVAVPNNS
ncbi:MAG: hypothetical protein CSA64_02150 [Arachnia propionica]|nr:MAG: hypothetical protein CSA64_02150 [Arachnia propionica]